MATAKKKLVQWAPTDIKKELLKKYPAKVARKRAKQNLINEEDGKNLMITGCAHNGIVNILEHFYSIKGRMPDCVIGGFHLSSSSGGHEDPETLNRIAQHLLSTKAKYYTWHCTGLEPYKKLKALMGDRIDYLATGSELTI